MTAAEIEALLTPELREWVSAHRADDPHRLALQKHPLGFPTALAVSQVALEAAHGGTSGTDDDDGIDHGISRWLWLCGRAQADGNSCLAAAAATTGGSGHDLRVAASMQTTVNSQSAESTPVSVLKSSWR